MRQSKITIYIYFIMLVAMSACYSEEPRPDATLEPGFKITNSSLPKYSAPQCSIKENTCQSSYLNQSFNVDRVSRFGRDSIIAFDSKKPLNKIKIIFSLIYDQDGIYKIYNGLSQYKHDLAMVVISGNKYGNNPIICICQSGSLYYKITAAGFDVTICNATFDYMLNSKIYTGTFSAHLTGP